MPKSKRNKVVNLTKTKSKGRDGKTTLVESIRGCVEQYPRLYVFRFKNLRNSALKKLREEMTATSRFFLGSNKVMQVALGKEASTAFRQGLEGVSERLKGFAGLLFTSLGQEEVEEMFALHEELDFARPGQKAISTEELPEGPVVGPLGAGMAHTLEPKMRASGMPTKLNHGVVELIAPHTICKAGEELNPKQCALLRMFDIKMAKFTMVLDSCWEDGDLKVISEPDDDDDMTAEDLDGLDVTYE
mmetsp:Transcript_25038/g.34503  ORF Transcript_25038/g.34503 Transcript_25038/m.34503 type:complete len:245 (+) Transcript_25038:226-960(+)|eukprot:CAMPEP_0196593576 /NCGR_PEP_ID=MMETSP1081-20130531/76015_1 /TAXON_ID=36882 /ORGANISM="Pyramimonas amylifera, Strain CCMP720" /LENGTH=244 /DNA_ID=CAMNT_0041917595 /DNA_START=224 /DNA_END=958 /DNA_ORIENTATION=+